MVFADVPNLAYELAHWIIHEEYHRSQGLVACKVSNQDDLYRHPRPQEAGRQKEWHRRMIEKYEYYRK